MHSIDKKKVPYAKILYIMGKKYKNRGTLFRLLQSIYRGMVLSSVITSKSSLNVLFMPALSAEPWTDCVTGYWHVSVFMFISRVRVVLCAHRSSAPRVCGRREQSCFKTIWSSEHYSGGLSLWFDQRTSQANSKAQAVSRACSGKKKKSSSFSLAQWAVFCAQGSHSLSPLTATVKLCRRYSQ